MNNQRINTARILYGTIQPISIEEAVEALMDIEMHPEVYLTNGEACRGYEKLRSMVEGNNLNTSNN